MKPAVIIACTVMLIVFLVCPPARAIGEGPVLPEAEVIEAPLTLDMPVLKGAAAHQTPAAGSEPSTSTTVFRDLPSINGRYSVAGTTFLPYLGAGFGSGYTSERDRSVQGGSSIQTDSGLRSLFGQNLAPNEFQMGVRIPF